MHCCVEPLEYYCIRFLPVQSCPKSTETKLKRIFIMQCCLEPLGQHGIGFLPVQCCLKSVKATLHRVFSYTKLSGASWATLHMVFSCAMLSQEY